MVLRGQREYGGTSNSESDLGKAGRFERHRWKEEVTMSRRSGKEMEGEELRESCERFDSSHMEVRVDDEL